MKKSEYARMAEMERTYWWHTGRLKIVEKQLQKAARGKTNLKILNIGCGTGGTIHVLEKFGSVTNVDVSDEAIKHMRKQGYDAIKVEGVKLPFKARQFDAVVALDVLEHIDEAETATKEWERVLKNGGSVLITVPAYQWLWSDHDVSLHHKRRYTKKLLRSTVSSKLVPKKITYGIGFSLPLVVGFRQINKALGRKMTEESSYVKLPGVINKLFHGLLVIEAWFLTFSRLPMGTSVIGLFNKPETEN